MSDPDVPDVPLEVTLVTGLPGEPIYEGVGAVPPGELGGFPIALGGRPFVVDLSHNLHGYRFQRTQVNLLNSQQQASDGDNSLVAPEVWRRYQDTWHLGSGQDRQDPSDAVPGRYADSEGINPWERHGISLLNRTELLLPLEGRISMVTLNQRTILVATGPNVYWIDYGYEPIAYAAGADIVSMTSDGTSGYLLLTTGVILKVADAFTYTTMATLPNVAQAGQSMLRFVKGKFLASAQNVLYEVFTTGTVNRIHGHDIPEYRWIDACDGLSVAYVLGGTGDHWHVHRLGVNKDDLRFSQPIVAAPLPEGEVGYALGSYLGYVMIGLSTGWRFALPDGSDNLSYGRLVSTKAPVECFESQDRFVWYGQSGDDVGLGRADLSTFVAPSTPAYANDLRTPDGTGSGRVGNAATVGAAAGGFGLRVFTVDDVGILIETAMPVESGWLECSLTAFNTTDEKRGVYAVASWESGPGEVDLSVAYDDSEFIVIASGNTEVGTGTGNIAIPEKFVAIRIRFDLHSIGAFSPVVTRWEVRSLPVYGKASQWRIPLLLHESLNVDDREVDSDPGSDYDYLVALCEGRQQFTYRERGRSWVVYATDFLWEAWRETQNGETYQGLFVISLRELR